MPVTGSTAAASCLKRPSARSGLADARPLRALAAHDRLLAAQPAAPGRRSARAIDRSAGQAEEMSLAAVAAGIVDDGRRPAGKHPAVIAPAVEARLAQPLRQPHQTAGGADRIVLEAELVIADQRDAPAAEREAGHAVELAGREVTVVHDVALRGDDRIAKARGQIEIAVGIGDQRPVARHLAAIGRDAARHLRLAAPRKTHECKRCRARAELPSVDHL